MINRVREIFDDIRGTAVLEMAFMTPVLLTIGLGVMEMGNLVYKRHLIQNGVRDAARYVAGVQGCNSTAGSFLAARGTIDNSGPLRVPGWTEADVTITCPSTASTAFEGVELRSVGGVIRIVKVTTIVDYTRVDLGFLDVLVNWGVPFNSLSFPVSHEERHYGFR